MKSQSSISPDKFYYSQNKLFLVDISSIIETEIIKEQTEEEIELELELEISYSYSYDVYELTLSDREGMAEYINTNYDILITFVKDKILKETKDKKFEAIQKSSQNSQTSFQFDSFTFEMSGQVETRLDRLERKIELDDTFVEMWFALDGTYNLGDINFIYVSKDNIQQFAQAYENKVRSVLSWKAGAEYWLNEATTIEEVEEISTEYPQ